MLNFLVSSLHCITLMEIVTTYDKKKIFYLSDKILLALRRNHLIWHYVLNTSLLFTENDYRYLYLSVYVSYDFRQV